MKKTPQNQPSFKKLHLAKTAVASWLRLLAGAVLALGLSGAANAHHTGDSEYYDVTITGVGLVSGGTGFRFTIDDPDRPEAVGLVFTSDEYSGVQAERLYALVLAAYVSKTPVKFVTWGAILTGKYVKVRQFDMGKEM
jgi:hypothetical protein